MPETFRSELADTVKAMLTMDQVARRYGFEPNRSGFIRCPFHSEKTASLKIYPGQGGFHCFGCGAGGSVIDFVMRLFDLSFSQAVVRLSADFGLGLTAARKTKAQASQILQKRRMEQEQKERQNLEYLQMAREHRYWWEIQKYFCPKSVGFVHPLYAQALKKLPYLEYWLDKNLSVGGGWT